MFDEYFWNCILLLANNFKHKTMHEMQHFKLNISISFSVSAFDKGQMISKVVFYCITSLKNEGKIDPEVQSG